MELLCLVGIIVFVFIFIIGPINDANKKYKRGGGKRRGKRRGKRKKPNGKIQIYVLKDGRKPFYVGQTTQSLNARLSQHMNDVSGNDKSMYIHNMRRTPTIHLVDSSWNQSKADSLENKYIGKWGLTNMRWA